MRGIPQTLPRCSQAAGAFMENCCPNTSIAERAPVAEKAPVPSMEQDDAYAAFPDAALPLVEVVEEPGDAWRLRVVPETLALLEKIDERICAVAIVGLRAAGAGIRARAVAMRRRRDATSTSRGRTIPRPSPRRERRRRGTTNWKLSARSLACG